MEDKRYEKRLLVLYASQTGNAMEAAERLGREADRRHCPVAVLSIDDFEPVCTPPFIYTPLCVYIYIYVHV